MYRIATVELELGAHIQCFSPSELAIHDGDQCIIENDRIQEFGRIIAVTECQDTNPSSKLPTIIRCATLQDQSKVKEVRLMSKMAMDTCVGKVEKFKLNMHLVRVQYSFDRKVLMVTFSAEERVDFRSLVKDMTRHFSKTIRLQQIGNRDEAKITGDIGPCGKNLCCKSHLKNLVSITSDMAEIQQCSHRGSDRISGVCGRLMCCLSYEQDCYEKCAKKLPAIGRKVSVDGRRGTVVGLHILKESVDVEFPATKGEQRSRVEVDLNRNKKNK